ncbi:ABC transporter permease [Paenibacillus sp. GCM10027627]|uniref:ABC transporter permease n=1 Tax=unclassified Paenibacillus TaxID=185978 RepID=UPI00362B973E
MKKYITVFRKSLSMQFVYNSGTLFSIISTLIFVLLQFSLWNHIVKNGDSSGAITLSSIATYIILGLIVRNLTSVEVSDFVAGEIKSGNIELYFVKPYSFLTFLLSRHLGTMTGSFVTRVFIIILICYPFIYSQVELNYTFFFYFVLSVLNAMALAFCIDYSIGMLAFVFVQVWPLKFLVRDIGNIFSGYFVPLWLFPSWLLVPAAVLPFKYIYFFPISILIGEQSEKDIVGQLLIGIAWTISLFILMRLLWSICRKRIIVQGG